MLAGATAKIAATVMIARYIAKMLAEAGSGGIRDGRHR